MWIAKEGLLDTFIKPTSVGGLDLCTWIVSIMTENRSYSTDQIYTAIQDSELDASVKALSKVQIETILSYMVDKTFNGITVIQSDCATISYEPPEEPSAYAGSDVSSKTTATLDANTPVTGSGKWIVFSGSGGSFDDDTSPTAIFTGTPGVTYVLMWILDQDNSLTVSKVTVTIT